MGALIWLPSEGYERRSNRQPQAAVLLHRFPERRDRLLCHLIARQQTWQVGISNYVPVYSFSRSIEDGSAW
jgi:hypothetical protein